MRNDNSHIRHAFKVMGTAKAIHSLALDIANRRRPYLEFGAFSYRATGKFACRRRKHRLVGATLGIQWGIFQDHIHVYSVVQS